jgi:hypothetical protein
VYVKNYETKLRKMNFIIWSYEDGPVRVEGTNTLLKTYTHRCEGSPAESPWQSRFMEESWNREKGIQLSKRDCHA